MSCHLRIEDEPHSFNIPEFYGKADLIIGFPCFTRPVNRKWVNAFQQIKIPNDITVGYIAVQGQNKVINYQGDFSKIGPARDYIVKKTIEASAKYLLFVDDDVEVPSSVVFDLLSILKSDPKIKVCGGVYAEKGPRSDLPFEPGIPVVWDLDEDDIMDWPLTPFECGAIGAGCMMIDTSVFKYLDFPIFLPGKNEDLNFCRKVRSLGFKVYAHGGVDCNHWAGRVKHITIRRKNK